MPDSREGRMRVNGGGLLKKRFDEEGPHAPSDVQKAVATRKFGRKKVPPYIRDGQK